MNHYSKRINKEIQELLYDTTHYLYANNKPFCSVEDIDDLNTRKIYCNIRGPNNSPYKGGIFKLCIKIPENYPYDHPTIKFLTPIYHPNLYSEDYFTIYNNNEWVPSQTIKSMLISIYSLMLEPKPEIICNINDDKKLLKIQKQYNRNYIRWKTIAKQWTNLYATKQLWNISLNKTITNIGLQKYVVYVLWLGKQFSNNINHAISDLWITNIMPHIIDKIGPDIITRKNSYNYNNRFNLLYNHH